MMNPFAQVPEGDEQRVLSCALARIAAGIPVAVLDQVCELEVSPPPPLSSKLFGGLAHFGDELVVVISLAQVRQPRRSTPAVLFRGEHAGVRWALEVSAVGSFVGARVLPDGPGPQRPGVRSWLRRAASGDGAELLLVDFPGMLAEALGARGPT